MSKVIIWILLFFPLFGAIMSYLTGRKNKKKRDLVVVVVTLVEAIGAAGLLMLELSGAGSVSTGAEEVLGFGIHFMTDGFRVVNNCGDSAGQTVKHLHFHLMSGRAFTWPAG